MKKVFLLYLLVLFSCSAPVEQNEEKPEKYLFTVTMTCSEAEDIGSYSAILSGSYSIQDDGPWTEPYGMYGFLFSENENPSFDNSTAVYVEDPNYPSLSPLPHQLPLMGSFSERVFFKPGIKYYYRSFLSIKAPTDGVIRYEDGRIVYLSSTHQITTPTPADVADLGLKTIWSTKNIGAASPVDSGDKFAFGETVPKTEFTWENYQWREALMNGTITPGAIEDIMDDFVRSKGQGWRLPTEEDILEIGRYCELYNVPQYYGVQSVLVRRNGKEFLLTPCWLDSQITVRNTTTYDPDDPRNPPIQGKEYSARYFYWSYKYYTYEGKEPYPTFSDALIYLGFPIRLVRDWDYVDN